MKKIKLLTPILGLSALSASLIPFATSCSCGKEEKKSTDKIIPSDLFAITNSNTCTGFVEGADISSYNTISIPSNVRVITAGAFNNKLTGITKIILPENIREIQDNAFANNSTIVTIDVSSWTEQSINLTNINATTTARPFEGLPANGKVIFNSNLSDAAKKQLISKLTDAGVPHSWFVDATEGNISFYNKEKTTYDANSAVAEFEFTLAKEIVSPAFIEVSLSQTSGEATAALKSTTADLSRKSVSVELTKSAGLSSGDAATFDLQFVCYNNAQKTSIAWAESIKDFKLTYVYKAKVEAIVASITKPSYVVGETLQLADINISAKYEGTEKYVPISCEKAWDVQASDNYTFTLEDATAGHKVFHIIAENKECDIDITVDPEATLACLLFHEVYDSEGKIASYEVSYNNDYGEKVPEIIIPTTYNGLKVTGFYGEGAFAGNQIINSIYIPNTITEIPNNTFLFDHQLQNVVFANGTKLAKIGDKAFGFCENLKNPIFPDTLMYIGEFAFQNDTSLSRVTDTNGYVYIKNNDNDYFILESCPENITTEMFNSNCKFIISLELNKINVGKTFTIPEGVIGIAPKAITCLFYSNIEEFILPSTLKSIGYGAFYSLAFPYEITITIPKSVSYISGNPCLPTGGYQYGPIKFVMEKGNSYYEIDDENDIIYNIGRTELVGSNPSNTNKFTMPDTVTKLSIGAFACSYRSITFSKNIETISPYAFNEYNYFEEDPGVELSLDMSMCTKLKEIPSYAFIYSCASEIKLPEGIELICTNAFDYSRIDSLNIPSTVQKISYSAFADIWSYGSDPGISFKDINGWYVYDEPNEQSLGEVPPPAITNPDRALDFLKNLNSSYSLIKM